ncbi:hypothetical protein BS78_03G271600 [Paspalum vaginatum]|nr:hypothetical protein BS78_03G271600 [Paspalum vaginatum]
MIAIQNKDKHIPFRNSKLTQLLQPYLIDEPKTLMLINISSEFSSIHESIRSLMFGETAKICEVGIPCS